MLCTVADMTETGSIREQLADQQSVLARAQHEREQLVIQGAEAGMSKVELANLSGLSRQTVYDILQKHADAKTAAKTDDVRRVEAMWKFGQVIEDRWGLRWRADYVTGLRADDPDRGRRWCLRSVGLRTRLTSARMAEREPLHLIRVDKVFAGDEAKAARLAGEAEDAAVTVTPHEDPEP